MYQGDVTAILDASGTAVVRYTYDAWGNLLTTTGSMASTLGAHNPLRYRGYVYDNETQLYYLQIMLFINTGMAMIQQNLLQWPYSTLLS